MNITQEYAEELIEALLAELGLEATRRDEAWAIAGPAGVELVVRATPEGAIVTATLADMESAAAECREAVAAFLQRAQAELRLVEAGVDENAASLEARADGEELEVELGRAIHATARACRLLVRETQALLRPDLAEVYLQHHHSVVSAGRRRSRIH